MQTLHTVLLLIVVAQCVWLGLTTGKHTPLFVRLCLMGLPLAAGAWVADIAYANYHVYNFDVAILLGVIGTVEAVRRMVEKHERKCEACEATRYGGSE